MVVSNGGMPGAWVSVLSPREREVAILVARGMANKEVARALGLSPGTVKLHVHSIFVQMSFDCSFGHTQFVTDFPVGKSTAC
jgi:DNA-binding NarL/FixJ family response regulator